MERKDLKLPLTVTSRVDVARMLRELNALNDYMVQAELRSAGQALKLPQLSRSLDDVAHENGLNLLDKSARKELQAKLNIVIGKAPVVHISFASEPSSKATQRILLWLRDSIHPQILMQIGLQPTIAAGIVVRTPNLLFDMSMRHFLKQQEPYLTQLIKEAVRAE